MDNNLDRIFDECVDRINRGESLDACLADYPDYVEQLKPLLQAMLTTKEAYSFVPSPSAKRAARQHFNAALEELERRRETKQPLFHWFLGRSKVWATVAAVLLIAVIGYLGLRPVLLPGGPVPQPGPTPVMPVPQPSLEGNFVFLISDDVNAIGDFESVDVSISSIGLFSSGDSGEWIEFEPELREVDLTLVQGDKTQEIWRGDVPEGQYSKVFIQVVGVHGILKETGEEVEIKLPSQKLHISKQFQITTDTVTSFTYDLTVIAAGNPQSGIKYILKPQVDQSGADSKVKEGRGKGSEKSESGNKKGRLNPINLPYFDTSTKVTLATGLTHLRRLRYTYQIA